MARITHEGFVQKVNKLVGEEYTVLGNYKNMQTKIEMKHNKCGNVYVVLPTSFIHAGTRCPECNGKKKVTKEMFQSHIEEIGYKLIGEYKKYSTKTRVKHIKCGYEWDVYPQNLYQNKAGCPKCAGNAKLTNEDFLKKVKLIDENKEYTFLENYKGYAHKIKCKHNCGYEWYIAPSNFFGGKRCPKCEGSMKKTQEEIDKRMEDAFKGEYKFLEKYINSDEPILCEHSCGYKWKIRPYNLFGGRKCPKCNRESSREKLISTILDNNNIKYEREKTFDGLKYKGKLRIDFYLTEHNIAIEYDGEHHFLNLRYTGSNNSLSLVQKRDSIKNDYCNNNDIKLYRIPYTKTDEEIIEEIEQIINVKSNAKELLT